MDLKACSVALVSSRGSEVQSNVTGSIPSARWPDWFVENISSFASPDAAELNSTEMSSPLSASLIFTSPLFTLLHPRRRSGGAEGCTSWEEAGGSLQGFVRGAPPGRRHLLVLARGVIQMARGVPSRNVAEIGAMRGIGEHCVVKRLLFEKSARLTDQRQQQKQSRETRLCRLHSRPRTRRKSRGQRICRGNHQPSRRDQTVGFQRVMKHRRTGRHS